MDSIESGEGGNGESGGGGAGGGGGSWSLVPGADCAIELLGNCSAVRQCVEAHIATGTLPSPTDKWAGRAGGGFSGDESGEGGGGPSPEVASYLTLLYYWSFFRASH